MIYPVNVFTVEVYNLLQCDGFNKIISNEVLAQARPPIALLPHHPPDDQGRSGQHCTGMDHRCHHPKAYPEQ